MIRFCLVLHNHQPIGNFSGVFEQAYQDSYLPFLDVFEPYEDLRISLHTSGPLIEWLHENHPEYLQRLTKLVHAGRVEIIGGSFYEAILAMLPSRDRVGQISQYTRHLEQYLGAHVQGMWMPERVWEQAMTKDIVAAGIKYTVLDDFHFKNAGLTEEELYGYYITEDDGQILSVFPGSERLRYLIPFGQPHETIDYLRDIAHRAPNAVIVFGDDGEKFGTWPDTKQHVYGDGWLRRFFDALVENKDWLHTTTLAEAVDNVPPIGKVYLPDGSYREMTEWALPVNQQLEYDALVHDLEHDPRFPRVKRFMRGGFWRNFKVKYDEANEMYSRMLQVSERFEDARREGVLNEAFDQARACLYRGQCNCPYWHGAFGGIYLPHLRNAVFNQLIAAENLLDQATHKPPRFAEIAAADYNFDARQEVRLTSDKLFAYVAPAAGGQMYELDVRSICHNLLATITRRPEAYHRKVLQGPSDTNGNVASIHDRVVFKQAGLDEKLQYDKYPRKSLLDHFWDHDVTPQSVARGEAEERGDFLAGVYDAKLRRNTGDKVQLLMTREGRVSGLPIKIAKGITLAAGGNQLEITYLLEGLPQDHPLHFGVEFNFAGLPSGADDRYFHRGGQRLGQLQTQLDLQQATDLGLVDEWLGIDVKWTANQPSHLWTFPIETVSQSEGGFELVHQSVCVIPHWFVRGDADGRWSVTMTLTADTSLAESRMHPAPEVAVV
jgi:4-alpha-glucanotransferase